MTVDEEKRKCSFIHSLPTGIYQLRVCLRSHLSAGPPPHPQTWHCVFVVWMQLSGWRVKSLTASLRLARTGRQRRSREGERRTETRDRPGLLSGRSVSVQPSAGRRGEKMGGQLLSPLMSTHFFHQLSIYRPVLHSCTPSRPSTHGRHGGWSLLCRGSPIKSIHSQTFQPPDLGRAWNTDSKIELQICLFKKNFKKYPP